MSLATLKLNDRMSIMDEQNIRNALNLAPESVCNKWTMVQSQSKYRLYAPMCMECLVSPHATHDTTMSFIEVDGKMTKMRIYCDIHGERQIRGRSLDVLRKVFFGSSEEDDKETPHERLGWLHASGNCDLVFWSSSCHWPNETNTWQLVVDRKQSLPTLWEKIYMYWRAV